MALTKITGQVINTATDVTVGVLTVTNTLAVGGTVSIAGTLTYEDVTNIDAVGLITARNGIVVGSGITLSKDGDIFATGVSTVTTLKVGSGVTVSSDGDIFATGISTFSEGIAGDLLIDDKIVHRGDTDTAIRFPAADTITAETGGTERLRITSGGLVGVNETPTISQFQVKTAQLGGTSGNTQEVVRLHSPDVSNTTSYRFTNYRTSNGTSHTTSELRFRRHVDATDMGYFGLGDGYSSIGYGTEEKVRIGSNGYVNIGSGTAEEQLTIRNTTQHCLVRIISANDSSAGVDFGDPEDTDIGRVRYYHSDGSNTNYMRFDTNGGEKLRINSGGHLGLNVTPGSWDSVPTFVALEGGGNNKHGSLHFQANGDWTTSLGCNHYYNGGWKYRHNGGASWLAMKEDELAFRLASSGSADGAISWDDKLTIDSSGNLRIPNDNAQLLIGASADLQLYHDTTGTDGTVIKNTTGDLYVQTIGDVKLRTNDSELAIDCVVNGAVHLYHDGASDSNLYTRYDGLTIRNNNAESTKDCNVDMIARVNGSAQLHMYADDNTDNNKKFQIKASNGETMDFNSYYTGGWDFHMRLSKGANNTSNRKVQIGKGGLRFDLGCEDYRDIDGDGHLFRRDGQAQIGVDDFLYIHDIDTGSNSLRLKHRFETNTGNYHLNGTVTPNAGLDYAEYFEWSDGNPSNEDRIGHTVSVDGLTGKIKIAEEGETVIGVISGTAGFASGAHAFSWQGRFKRDEWGRGVYEEQKDENGNLIYADAETRAQIVKVEPVETEEYNPLLENSYVPRELRKEWDIVGLMGQIRVRKTAVIPSNWVKLKEIDSVKDLYLVR